MDVVPRRPARRHDRKFTLSSDSVPPLPVYSPGSTWNNQELHSDRPPDYPDSSEADAEDESDEEITPLSPRRSHLGRFPSSRSNSQRHHQTSSDIYLDSLLARSVHALEISNTLLQSSMSTQTSLSTLLTLESTADRSLEDKARDLSSRIKRNRNVHESWMDDIDEIGKGVDILVDMDSSEDSVSQSLPTSGLAPLAERNHRRRPSLQVLSPEGHLDYSKHDRSHFISPAPRALTLYIDSNDSPSAIKLPPTLGHRSSPSTSAHLIQSAPQSSRRATFSDSCISEMPHRAYDILSSYATSARSSPKIPTATLTPTASRSRRGSASILPKRRRSSSTASHLSDQTTSDRTSPCKTPRGRSLTPLRIEPPSPNLPRPMTPPIEELSSNSSSSEMLFAVKSLRKILDDQTQAEQARLAQSASKASLQSNASQSTPRPPALLARTASTRDIPIASTSHATASISRLLTKGIHSSSTRRLSPPRHSSLRSPSAPVTPSPSPSPSMLSIPSFFGSNSPMSGHSGRSTPSRVTFAELPESYSSSKPEGSVRFRERSKDKRKKAKAEEDDLGWWGTWLFGGGVSGSMRHDDRLEERSGRWGMKPPGSGPSAGMDEWTF